MIENYIYNYHENDDNSLKYDIIDFIEEYFFRINDNLEKSFLIRLFNEEENIIQIQIKKEEEELNIFDIELKNEYISINQSILDSSESNPIEEDIEIFKIKINPKFKRFDLYIESIINFLSNYLYELYEINDFIEIMKIILYI